MQGSNTLSLGAANSRSHHGPQDAWRLLVPTLALAAFFVVAAGLQVLAGAYDVELSGYPDEPSHFVTGVLFKDYLTTFPPQPVVPFAKEFYIRRPKVAVGHWPPVLYVLEGIWFALFHASRRSALALMALICALVAASVYHLVRRRYGNAAGIAAGLLFVCLGFVQTQTSQVMADMLVALFGLWATIAFADFLAARRRQDILRFAIFSILAIFSKNNGLYLVLTPLIAMVLTKQLGVLRSPRLWLGASIVAIPTAAWVVWSNKFVASSWAETPSLGFFVRASRLNLSFLYFILGPCFLILIAAGMFRDRIGSRSTADPLPATLTSAALSVLLFQSVAPAGIESRFLLPAIAALIPLVFSGLMSIVESLGPRTVAPLFRAAVLLATAALISPGRTFAIPHKPYRGFSEVADFIQSQPRLRQGTILVSSASDGEGLLISEIVMRYPSSLGIILRASKVLSQSDWLGRSYSIRFVSAHDVFQYLDEMGVDLIVIEEQEGVQASPHQDLLLQVDPQHVDHWRRVGIFPKRSPSDLKGSRILVYERIDGSIRSNKNVYQDMEKILEGKLGK